MPPNTILLSAMLREVSANPGFREAFVRQIEGLQHGPGKHGPALLTPKLADELRKRVLGDDWAGLDRFPGWTMRAINPTVRAIQRVAAGDAKTDAATWLDTGPYTLAQAGSETFAQPSTLAGFSSVGPPEDLGAGIQRGDGPNPQLAPMDAESARLAYVLNRLAANALEGTPRFSATVFSATVMTPEDLIESLAASGHRITVTDSRYFANFGHLHYRRPGSGESLDVMMPFWVNTGWAVPHSGAWLRRSRPLLVPVAHAELEWHVRGPRINADVSWYFGIDGKAEWRTMDTLDQAWVLHRDAHVYQGGQALEATRLAARFTVAYLHQHAARPQLPFGGYYALGVCQDSVAAIEHRLTGRGTLFPNTADDRLFDDPRDAEVNTLLRAIPKDRDGGRPDAERVFASLPVAPAPGPRPFAAVTIPGLADDLDAAYNAMQGETLTRWHGRVWSGVVAVCIGAAIALAFVFRAKSARRRRSSRRRRVYRV